MTLFVSDWRSAAELCRAEVEACQVWVGILGHRYGSRLPDGRWSYTEMEYRHAVDKRLMRLPYLIHDDAAVGLRDEANSEDVQRQKDFRDLVRTDVVAGPVITPDDVFTDLVIKLASKGIQAPPPTARSRPPQAFPVHVSDHLDQAGELRRRLLAHDDRVVVLTGHGGVGKTALVSRTFDALLADRSPEAFGTLDYVSASGHLWLTGDTVLKRLVHAIRSPTARAELDTRWQRASGTWYERIEDALDTLDENVLLVVDDVQYLLDDADRFVDNSLNQLVTTLSRRDDHRVTLLLVSRTPPAADVVGLWDSAVLPLGTALPDDASAEDFLVELAREVGTRLAAEPRAIVGATGRLPRMLELFVAVLTLRGEGADDAPPPDGSFQGPTEETLEAYVTRLITALRRQRVLRRSGGADHELVDVTEPEGAAAAAAIRGVLIRELAGHLPEGAVPVLYALAVLGLPAGASDVRDVLAGSPGSANRPDVRMALRRLARLRVVRVRDDAGSPYDLQAYQLPVDDSAAIVALLEEESQDDVLNALRHRAIRQYTKTQRLLNTASADNLAARFREVALRMELGEARRGVAQFGGDGFADRQFADCVLLMNELAESHLRAVGRRHLLSPLRRRLLGWRGDELWRSNISELIAAAVEVDRPDEADHLLDALIRELDGSPEPVDPEARRRLAADRVDLQTQRGHAAFHDGRLRDAERHFLEELSTSSSDFPRMRANLGIAMCLLDLGDVDGGSAALASAQGLAADLGAAGLLNDGQATLPTVVEAELARLRGNYDLALSVTEESVRRLKRAGGGSVDRVLVQLLDLQAVLHLESSLGASDSQEDHLEDALRAADEAADIAARFGIVDITRTAHTTLAQVHLRGSGEQDLGHARKAALSAVSFHGGKRGLVAHVALGAVRLRDRRHRGSEERARESFHNALRVADLFPEDQRPYWVWDAVGEAETGLHLCRVADAERRAVAAFGKAREAAPHRGAARRAALFIDILSTGSRVGSVAGIRAAACVGWGD
jgi:hypothetical protein